MNVKGSEWNIWDLHIHTPCSIKNQYGGNEKETWDKFIDYLENLPKEVKVIGINDYYFIDGFYKVMEYKMLQNRLQNIDKIFPLIEFRIDTFATASESEFQKINLHVLFNIDDSKWKEEITKINNEFINQIHMSCSERHKTKTLSKQNFIECGKGKLDIGFAEVIPSTKEVFDIINSHTWRDKIFTFLGYKEWNNLEKGQQLKEVKDNLFQKVDAFFTASPNDNIAQKEEVIENFGQKVLVHSSDIHNFEQLHKDKHKCFTWIKADTNFEGLKQIIFEPKERIRIQKNNPTLTETKTNVIDKVRFGNQEDWFEDREIEINAGLVSIIGEKGAGKTALLDLLAVANGEGIYEQDIKSPYAFYFRAKELLKNMNVEIRYRGDEEPKRIVVGDMTVKPETNKDAKVRYLSLKELEGYCDNKEKLQTFIKGIIHTGNNEITEADSKSHDTITQISLLNERIITLQESNENETQIKAAVENKTSELENHIKNEPKIMTNFTEEQEVKFKGLLLSEQNINKKIRDINEMNINIFGFESWIESELTNIRLNFENALQSKANSYIDIKEKLLNSIKLNISVDGLDSLIEIYELNLVQKQSLANDLAKIEVDMKPLSEINSNLEAEKVATQNWLIKKTELESELVKLRFELEKINANSEQIKKIEEQRENYIKALLNIKSQQKDKYEELKTQIEGDSNIKFEVKISFDKERFIAFEDTIINHGSGKSQEEIVSGLSQMLLNPIENALQTVNQNEIINIYSKINIEFITEIFGANKTKQNLLKRNFTMKDFYNWIYGDYYKVDYIIKYKDRLLETLSPGQKGLVLMKIFLKLDADTKPLLIDQPEDNLDNKSVFVDLVNDIKDIKKKRQIIIATHNPNLVVNTDSEQVIIAKFEDGNEDNSPKVRYVCGPLENEIIKKEVCDILEGGDVAFLKRERRYSL